MGHAPAGPSPRCCLPLKDLLVKFLWVGGQLGNTVKDRFTASSVGVMATQRHPAALGEGQDLEGGIRDLFGRMGGVNGGQQTLIVIQQI